MNKIQTSLLTLALLLILGVGARFAKAAQPAAGSPESVELRTTRLTRYLTTTLQLSRSQQRAVAASTRRYLRQLEEAPATPQRGELVALTEQERLLPASSVGRIEEEYQVAMGRILTPGQYNAYSWLHMHQPETSR